MEFSKNSFLEQVMERRYTNDDIEPYLKELSYFYDSIREPIEILLKCQLTRAQVQHHKDERPTHQCGYCFKYFPCISHTLHPEARLGWNRYYGEEAMQCQCDKSAFDHTLINPDLQRGGIYCSEHHLRHATHECHQCTALFPCATPTPYGDDGSCQCGYRRFGRWNCTTCSEVPYRLWNQYHFVPRWWFQAQCLEFSQQLREDGELTVTHCVICQSVLPNVAIVCAECDSRYVPLQHDRWCTRINETMDPRIYVWQRLKYQLCTQQDSDEDTNDSQ